MLVHGAGVAGVNGNGQLWQYTDGWAYRKSGTMATSDFAASDWVFSGPGALTGAATNAASSSPFPLKSYQSAETIGMPIILRSI